MDTLTFVSELVKALAWPIATVSIFLVLRKPLLGLLGVVQKLKWKDIEVEFGKHAQEVRKELAEDLPQPQAVALSNAPADAVLRLAEISPRAAVMEAWREVELAALDVAGNLPAIDSRPRNATYDAIRRLERSQSLAPHILGAIRDLRSLRNQAAHSPEFAISAEAALDYAASAKAVAEYLRRSQPAA